MNDLRQTFDYLQKIFFARLLPRVDPSHVLVVAARRCVGTSRREAADAVWGAAGMMTAWPCPAPCVGVACTHCVRCTADMLTVMAGDARSPSAPSMAILLLVMLR